MKNTLTYLIIAVLAISVVFTSCDKNKDDDSSGNGNGNVNAVKWATCNVDAPGTFAANPEDAGMFYQWNRKTGWSSTEPMINSDGGTTWNSSIPTGDSWEKVNDPCPEGWRIPTHSELKSLKSANRKWGTLNGVLGMYFDIGDQEVFFPAVGTRYWEDGRLQNVGCTGHYWSSTPVHVVNDGAFGMYFNEGGVSWDIGSGREVGFSVRCVAE